MGGKLRDCMGGGVARLPGKVYWLYTYILKLVNNQLVVSLKRENEYSYINIYNTLPRFRVVVEPFACRFVVVVDTS